MALTITSKNFPAHQIFRFHYCPVYVTSVLPHSSNTMDITMRAIIMFLSMLKVLVWAHTLENSILQQQNLPKEDCDSMVVSPSETDEGMATFS